jgi:hypothetical protein
LSDWTISGPSFTRPILDKACRGPVVNGQSFGR